jgi:hypothetical protein
MTRHYCTYFDARYLARGLALYHSLRRHAGAFVLHALCLDRAAFDAVRALRRPDLHALDLDELERAEPALLQAKAQRSKVEYYFTLTPVLTQHVLDTYIPGTGRKGESLPGAEVAVTYLDSDLYFYADPEPVFTALGAGSVLVIEHRYPAALQDLDRFGRFNVGWLTFRGDSRGRACLAWWKERCLEWCYDRLEEGRYADQKYLDEFPRRFGGVVVLPHKGVNLAPWNLTNYRIACRDGRVWVDDDPLIMYHFHRLRVIRPTLFDPGLERYGAVPNPVITRRIYAPYLRELQQLQRQVRHLPLGNLRLAGPASNRDMWRLVLYGHPILAAGPVATQVHLEPLARPLLRLRARTLDLLGLKRAA